MVEIFPTIPAPNQSVPFDDLKAGTGFTTYYLSRTSEQYVLSNVATYSDGNFTSDTTGGANSWNFDKDFDVRLNRATMIRGTCIFNVPVNCNLANRELSIKVILKKVSKDGLTETDISSGSSRVVDFAAGSPDNENMFAGQFTISGQKIASKETLRATVLLRQGNDGQAASAYKVFHDPLDITSGEGMTTFPGTALILVPQKIDV